MLNPTLLGLIETAVNRYLALDPEISVQLGELEGKIICFELTTPAMTLYCKPHVEALDLLLETEESVDCTIKGSAMDLLKMMRSDEPAQSLSNGEIEITGDSRIAQRFSDILKDVEIDWEELISKVTGDFAAHRIGGLVGQMKSWFGNTTTALRMDSTEYLQEESGVLPTRPEIERFMNNVDELRSDVDRLEARIRRLEKARLTQSGES